MPGAIYRVVIAIRTVDRLLPACATPENAVRRGGDRSCARVLPVKPGDDYQTNRFNVA
jgi:hypothetical protein